MKPAAYNRAILRVCKIVMLCSTFVPAVGLGQEVRNPDQTAPPPLKFISRVERDQIQTTKDSKARLRLTIELAESHLAVAETKTTERDFDAAASGAGRYWALIDDAIVFLKTLKGDSNKTRDLFKRLELTLRAHAPRLTTIRRNTPAEYAVWIKDIEEFARRGRTEALNSFYGTTVVRDTQVLDDKKTPKPTPQNSVTPPP